jgi:ABC-type glycerol-3-phosphate transport system substrate-binding protein
MPRSVVGVSQDQIKQEFMTGQLAMYRSGSWDFADLDTSGVEYAMAPFPALSGGEPFVGGGPDSPYVISAKISGAKLAAAEKFLSFVNSAEGLKLASKSFDVISTSKAYSTKVPAQMEDVYKDYLKAGKYYWLNVPSGFATMSQQMIAQWELLIQGSATPQQVTDALDKAWASVKK